MTEKLGSDKMNNIRPQDVSKLFIECSAKSDSLSWNTWRKKNNFYFKIKNTIFHHYNDFNLENIVFEKCEISNSFTKCNLSSSRFEKCYFHKADFTECKMYKSSFSSCRLIGVDFHGSDLENSNFDNTDIQLSLFTNTNLKNTSFEDSVMSGVNIDNSIFENVNLNRATLFNIDGVAESLQGMSFQQLFFGSQRGDRASIPLTENAIKIIYEYLTSNKKQDCHEMLRSLSDWIPKAGYSVTYRNGESVKYQLPKKPSGNQC